MMQSKEKKESFFCAKSDLLICSQRILSGAQNEGRCVATVKKGKAFSRSSRDWKKSLLFNLFSLSLSHSDGKKQKLSSGDSNFSRASSSTLVRKEERENFSRTWNEFFFPRIFFSHSLEKLSFVRLLTIDLKVSGGGSCWCSSPMSECDSERQLTLSPFDLLQSGKGSRRGNRRGQGTSTQQFLFAMMDGAKKAEKIPSRQ